MKPSTTACRTDRSPEPRRFSAGVLLHKGRQLTAWLLVSALSSSCCTTALWDATDPNETIEVSPEEVTEAALIEDGFTFHRDESSGYYHIEKSPRQKRIDYSLRVVGAPVTVSADTLLSGLLLIGLGTAGVDPAEANWSALNL